MRSTQNCGFDVHKFSSFAPNGQLILSDLTTRSRTLGPRFYAKFPIGRQGVSRVFQLWLRQGFQERKKKAKVGKK
jgi:hypothetical protein